MTKPEEKSDERKPLPDIEDNSKGVAGHVLCVVWCWGENGHRYRMPHVPRQVLESGQVFPKIVQLAEEAGGLKRIMVEVEVP